MLVFICQSIWRSWPDGSDMMTCMWGSVHENWYLRTVKRNWHKVTIVWGLSKDINLSHCRPVYVRWQSCTTGVLHESPITSLHDRYLWRPAQAFYSAEPISEWLQHATRSAHPGSQLSVLPCSLAAVCPILSPVIPSARQPDSPCVYVLGGLRCLQQPGDVIFVPEFWAHGTKASIWLSNVRKW